MDASVIIRIASIGLLVTVVTMLLKKGERDEFATIISLCGIIIALLIVVGLLRDLFAQIRDIFLI